MPLTMEEYDALPREVRKALQDGTMTEAEAAKLFLSEGATPAASAPGYTPGTFRPSKGKPRRNVLTLRDR